MKTLIKTAPIKNTPEIATVHSMRRKVKRWVPKLIKVSSAGKTKTRTAASSKNVSHKPATRTKVRLFVSILMRNSKLFIIKQGVK